MIAERPIMGRLAAFAAIPVDTNTVARSDLAIVWFRAPRKKQAACHCEQEEVQ